MSYKVCNKERLHIADCEVQDDRPSTSRCHIESSKEYSCPQSHFKMSSLKKEQPAVFQDFLHLLQKRHPFFGSSQSLLSRIKGFHAVRFNACKPGCQITEISLQGSHYLSAKIQESAWRRFLGSLSQRGGAESQPPIPQLSYVWLTGPHWYFAGVSSGRSPGKEQ